MIMLKASVLAVVAVCSVQAASKRTSSLSTTKSGLLSLPVSRNLKCGPKAKTVCPGSLCCSKNGVCSRSASACGVGCQKKYGHCAAKKATQLGASSTKAQKGVTKKSALKKYTLKKSTVTKKAVAKKAVAKKAAAKKTTAAPKKTAAKKTTKKTAAAPKKSAAKKAVAKKAIAKKVASVQKAAPATKLTDWTKVLSKTGQCGPKHGRCKGSLCCSEYGYCGSDVSHCVSQCNPLYGECGKTLSPAVKALLTKSGDKRCGRQYNKVCSKGFCCSRDGQCGTSTSHCGIGCQGLFGICKPPITKLPAPVPAHPSHKNYLGAHTRCVNPGQIAITFEGGTDSGNVPKVLDALKSAGVRATFFVNGFNANNMHYDGARNIVKRIYSEGHQVGSGTLCHSKLSQLSPLDISLEMSNNDWMIQQTIGLSPVYMRTPHNEQGPKVIKQLVGMGYVVVSHNVDSGDSDIDGAGNPGTQAVIEFDKSISHHHGASPKTHSFITLHNEWVENGHSGIQAIVQKYRKLGYTFVTVGECLGQPNPKSWYRVRDFKKLA
ncbi:hypothetical protein QVD99_004809 [Batrachochytrium dendrobatidis]|nr:hypothetical protein O5D80_003048 [Batrachochytrium dendrobatidis]KAK5669045.1 hypothetical protein QVD99_004809 [Batrachochytrium dendrobatidis]